MYDETEYSKSPGGEPRDGDPSDAKVITARGTEDGLVLRIDGKAEWLEIIDEVESFLGGRKKFFEGGELLIEWLDRLPTMEQSKQLEELLRNSYGIEITVRKKRPSQLTLTKELLQPVEEKPANKPLSLSVFEDASQLYTVGTNDTARPNDAVGPNDTAAFLRHLTGGGEPLPRGSFGSDLGELSDSPGKRYGSRMAKMLGEELFYEDDANAKVVFGTLRSGQRVETPFTLIVVGDVNPGADLVAGGDIIVFGGLRGTAHASAYDDDAFDRVILALQMQPMQLRIGSVISRGSDEVVKGAEIARIENRRIIVEAFNPRAVLGRKLR